MRVLFISYIEHSGLSSGSEVRTAKMLQAFREEGHELITLTGWQTAADRVEKIRGVLREIRRSKPDLCYIESPTYPIMRHADRKLIRTIHRMGIPIGYFYRDFYRKFPDEFPRRRSLRGRAKEFALDILQALTDRCLYSCDIVYFPCLEACDLFRYPDMRALPPAGENKLPQTKKRNNTAIYVGGLTGAYDGKFILDCFSYINRNGIRYKLLLICREEELKKLRHPGLDAAWIEIHHASQKEIAQYYERASVGISIKSDTRYNRYAVSVKTYEYLAFGLPQITSKGEAVKRLIDREKIGISIDMTAEDFEKAMDTILGDDRAYEEYQNNVRKSLLDHNLWVHRVRRVVDDLSAIR